MFTFLPALTRPLTFTPLEPVFVILMSLAVVLFTLAVEFIFKPPFLLTIASVPFLLVIVPSTLKFTPPSLLVKVASPEFVKVPPIFNSPALFVTVAVPLLVAVPLTVKPLSPLLIISSPLVSITEPVFASRPPLLLVITILPFLLDTAPVMSKVVPSFVILELPLLSNLPAINNVPALF